MNRPGTSADGFEGRKKQEVETPAIQSLGTERVTAFSPRSTEETSKLSNYVVFLVPRTRTQQEGKNMSQQEKGSRQSLFF